MPIFSDSPELILCRNVWLVYISPLYFFHWFPSRSSRLISVKVQIFLLISTQTFSIQKTHRWAHLAEPAIYLPKILFEFPHFPDIQIPALPRPPANYRMGCCLPSQICFFLSHSFLSLFLPAWRECSGLCLWHECMSPNLFRHNLTWRILILPWTTCLDFCTYISWVLSLPADILRSF